MRLAWLVATTITLLHFSDYHSHALPSYSEDGADRGGFARALGYLGRHKRDGAIVFSGGDMMNKGAPAWSDRYGCTEWTWLDGIVDAMAFGNHEADYGYAEFARCRDSVSFPILSANTAGFPPYTVIEASGIRVGAFAVAGSDFSTLVRVPEIRFGDSVAAAREAVRILRDQEKVDAVVLIGHQSTLDDFALARSVPGIDLIFGTHSHLTKELTRIEGTQTWFISPGQYLNWISRVEMTFDDGRLSRVTGRLIPVDRRMRANRTIAMRLEAMQKELERDRRYRDLFVPLATLRQPISAGALGELAVDLMKERSGAAMALSTRSSFRAPLPAGTIDMEILRSALPYDNEIVTAELPAARAQELMRYAARQIDDAAVYTAGVPRGDRVLIATTDYLAFVAPGYRDFFSDVDVKRTGIRVREEMRKHLAAAMMAPQ